MLDMICMSTKPKQNYWGKAIQVRVHPEAKRALTRTKVNLSETGLQLRGKSLTEEAIINVLCIWAEQQDTGALVEYFSSIVARLESLVGKKGEDGGEGEGNRYTIVDGNDPVPAPDPAVPARTGKPRRKSS